MRVAILTISDSTFGGDRSDTSGDAISEWCDERGDSISAREKVVDESSEIVAALARLCDTGDSDLVITTGGTGLSPRDVTPEATGAVIEREAQGIAEFIRAGSFTRFPKAALSRGIAGVRGATLIINLPGSTSGVKDGLAAIAPIIDHAIDVLTGKVTRHDATP